MNVEPTKERLDAPVLIAVIMLRSPADKPPPEASTADIFIYESNFKTIERFDVFRFSCSSFPSRGVFFPTNVAWWAKLSSGSGRSGRVYIY